MAIDQYDSITYGELTSAFINWVKTNCNNVDSYSSSVPAALKSGFSKSYTKTESRVTTTATFSINSYDVVPVTTTATVESQINTFLTDRNIIQRKDAYITTSGLLNFWQNIAIFCNKKLYLVSSQYVPTPILMYNPTVIRSYDALPNMTDNYSTPHETPVLANDFITIAKAFDSSLFDFAKSKYIVYSLTVTKK